MEKYLFFNRHLEYSPQKQIHVINYVTSKSTLQEIMHLFFSTARRMMSPTVGSQLFVK